MDIIKFVIKNVMFGSESKMKKKAEMLYYE